MKFSLLDDTDVSQAFAAHLRGLREQAKLSREALAQRSCVPAPTIKKFELTGQISFRQLLLRGNFNFVVLSLTYLLPIKMITVKIGVSYKEMMVTGMSHLSTV